MPDGFSVDARSLSELAIKLRRSAELSRVEVDRSMAVIGEAHRAAAVAALDGHSSSIPPTIRSQPIPGTHTVRLTAAGTALAWSYERGNKSNRRGKTFIHPVYAKKGDPRYEDRSEWEPQQRYPFFSRARRTLRKWTLKTLSDGWAEGLRKSGIKVDRWPGI